MTIGARGYRDERRRRVMLDESRAEDRVAPVEPPRGGKRKRYGSDTLAGAQPHVTDFLPERRRILLSILAISLLASATAITLYWFSPQWEASVPRDSLRFLQTFQPGGLLNLTQGWHWLMGSYCCGLIYAIRRRRLDDYRGTFRIWALSAVLLAAWGIYSMLPLSPLVTWGIMQIPRMPQLPNPTLVYMLTIGTGAGLLLVRWLIEVRRCRLAQSCLVAAGVLAILSTLNAVSLLRLSSYQLGEVITGSCFLLGQLLMLVGLLVYGRHVRLDAQGLIAHGKKKVLKKKKAVRIKRVEEDETTEDDANSEETSSEETDDSDDGPVVKTSNATITRRGVTAVKEEAEDEDEDSDDSRLSKAERKKLRREQRRAS